MKFCHYLVAVSYFLMPKICVDKAIYVINVEV